MSAQSYGHVTALSIFGEQKPELTENAISKPGNRKFRLPDRY